MEPLFNELIAVSYIDASLEGSTVLHSLRVFSFMGITWSFFFLAGCWGSVADWFPRSVGIYSFRDILLLGSHKG